MKRQLILLLILVIPLTIIGQNNIQKTTEKTLNDTTVISLIFAEHQKLIKENSLLTSELDNYKQLLKVQENIDSLRVEEIHSYQEALSNSEKHIKKLKSSRRKLIFGSSVGGIVLFILGILI